MKCTECNAEEEFILSTPEERPTKCYICGAPLKQVFAGPPALRFNGPGFWATDSKKEKTDEN